MYPCPRRRFARSTLSLLRFASGAGRSSLRARSRPRSRGSSSDPRRSSRAGRRTRARPSTTSPSVMRASASSPWRSTQATSARSRARSRRWRRISGLKALPNLSASRSDVRGSAESRMPTRRSLRSTSPAPAVRSLERSSAGWLPTSRPALKATCSVWAGSLGLRAA
jgi:hypothetical protein